MQRNGGHDTTAVLATPCPKRAIWRVCCLLETWPQRRHGYREWLAWLSFEARKLTSKTVVVAGQQPVVRI